MPINRPNLNLNIPPLNIVAAYDGAEIPSTNKHLKNNFNSLHNQMRKMPVSHFKEALDVPDYSGMRQSGFFAMSQGFQLNNHGYDVFIHARRESPQSQGKFAGDKFHISVLRDMVPEPRQPGGCKLKTAPVRPVVAARPAEYVCSEDLFY